MILNTSNAEGSYLQVELYMVTELPSGAVYRTAVCANSLGSNYIPHYSRPSSGLHFRLFSRVMIGHSCHSKKKEKNPHHILFEIIISVCSENTKPFHYCTYIMYVIYITLMKYCTVYHLPQSMVYIALKVSLQVHLYIPKSSK